ncbi:BON domain-containing protein [Novosphingobium album (ex Liu et al. 2023)]|uniref:BON domain-containing protein n=1 Tax=Novosphingobium album (ex Liu et al. 2023) TaxID=3031130 RepID=A0ABT5WLE1_9SPHN|nr:BON domain-containing protein [Novosphingobium album (ex Liu et al. 2023)]MDE8650850.1 BON domain-containing protein [Novosphingobium album (ex Liu et al. 2023)]
MNDRDRHSQQGRQPNQGGGYGNDFYDGPRQQNQFAEGARQAGSDWRDHGQRGQRSPGQMGSAYDGNFQASQPYADEQRRIASASEADYREDRGGYAREQRGYRGAYPARDQDEGYRGDFSSFTGADYGGRDFYASRGRGYAASAYQPGLGGYGQRTASDYGEWRAYGEQRGFLERAGDEIASWFGDEDAARRREQDHSGRGPADYTRSDERIREDANDRLTHDRNVDARNVTVAVSNGEVTLSGTVDTRQAKRRAEDVVDQIPGVRHVQNNLRVDDGARTGTGANLAATGTGRAATGTSRVTEKTG